MMKKTTYVALALSLFLLVGCSTAGEAPPHFGNSVRQNIAAQIINPDAPDTNSAPVHEGTRTSVAQGRYISDTVEKPETTTTSSMSSGGE